MVVADSADFILDYQWVSIAINPGGRLVIIDETPYEDNHAFYSDDFGATWTEAAYQETNALDRVLGPVNGKFWVEDGEFRDDNGNIIQTDVQYVSSEDGVSWSGMQMMLPSIPSSTEVHVADIAKTGDTSYLAAFSMSLEDPCCSQSIGLSTSTDNGVTWSPLATLDTGIAESRNPRISTDGEGTIYLTFVAPNPESAYYNDEVFTAESTDGGATFSTPKLFTRYVGSDYNVAQAMLGSDPFLAFQSERGTQNYKTRVWYGMGGANRTPDLDPPPVADWYDSAPGWIPANRMFPLGRIIVLDESGVAGAELHVSRGEESTIVPLFDDGAHDDNEAGDGIFGGTSSATPYGPNLQVYPVGTDTGDNEGYGFAVDVAVASLHDIGNLVTAITPDGATGYEPLQDFPTSNSVRFPKESDFNFMAYAGLWVGINKAPGKRVSHLFYDNYYGPDGASTTYGDWQVTEYPTEAPGESEMDVVMHYDDSGAQNPIGLSVKQTTYQWSDANYIIYDYEITNESGGDLTDLYAAMAADPDMPTGADPFDDQIGYNGDRALLYALDSGNSCAQDFPELCTDTHVGLALLSDGSQAVGKAVPTPHTANRWSGFGSDGDPQRNPNTGLDLAMYDLMTAGIWAGFNLGLLTNVDEWRMVLTAQPFDLAAGETRRLVFGLVAGAGEAGILASTDGMIERYEKAVLAVEQTGDVPTKFALEQNYPNPFNPSTTIPFSVTSSSPVTLTVFDVLGRQVERIVNETLSAGSYTATFESQSLPSGAYYYTLTADGQSITKSMFLLK